MECGPEDNRRDDSEAVDALAVLSDHLLSILDDCLIWPTVIVCDERPERGHVPFFGDSGNVGAGEDERMQAGKVEFLRDISRRWPFREREPKRL